MLLVKVSGYSISQILFHFTRDHVECGAGKVIRARVSEVDLAVFHIPAAVLVLGNAGVVKVTLNGKELGTLGAQGKVVKQSFNVSDDLSAYIADGQ